MSHFKCGPSVHGWPVLTLVGITCAVLVGLVHASLCAARACLLGEDDLAPSDGFGPDGYSS